MASVTPIPDVRNALNTSSMLNGTPDDIRANLQRSGAMNAGPPLPHSPCLRNKETKLVLPWNPLIAEMRDIMENCDEYGNTDPAAWRHKVIDDTVSDDEAMAANRAAAQKVVADIASHMAGNFHVDPTKGDRPTINSEIVKDAMPYEQYLKEQEEKLKAGMDRVKAMLES